MSAGFKVCQGFCQYPGTEVAERHNEACFCTCKAGYAGRQCQLGRQDSFIANLLFYNYYIP